MELCVCNICTCGTHKCRQRFLKDGLGQYLADSTLPVSETKASYHVYESPRSTEIIRPLQADWNYQPGDRSLPFVIDRDFDSSRGDFAARTTTPMQVTVEEPKSHQTQEPATEIPLRTREAVTQTLPPIQPIISPRNPPKLPSLLDTTVHKSSYRPPPPMSQMPNCADKGSFKPLDVSMSTQTLTMKDYPEWNLKAPLRAPNPRTGSLKMGPPEDNLKPPKLPMENITTFRVDYGSPPFNFEGLKLVLMKNSNAVRQICPVPKCKLHSIPEEIFFNRTIYSSTYRNAYCPPCVHLIGACQHKGTESKTKSDRCPAALLNYCYSPNNYEFKSTCCGHDIFIKKGEHNQ